MNLPNVLSLSRIILVPIFVVVFFLFPEYSVIAAVILLVSGITDFLDGMLARKLNQITQLGKILDPLADKLTQLTVFICLAIRHKEFIIILCLIVAKEIIMLIIGFRLLREGYMLPSAKWFGKVSTVVFYLIMIYVVYDVGITNHHLAVLVNTMLVFAAMSFLMYIPEFFKLKKTETGGQKSCAEIISSVVKEER